MVERPLVVAVLGGLELERAMCDVEVVRQAVTELVEYLPAAPVGHKVVYDDHMSGQYRYPRRNCPYMKVVDVTYTRYVKNVRPDVVQVDMLRRRLQQDVHGVP